MTNTEPLVMCATETAIATLKEEVRLESSRSPGGAPHSLRNAVLKSELFSYTNKSTQHPEYLRQLALETIQKISCDVLQIYTDGSNMGVGIVTSSRIFIKKGNCIRICKRNPDYCSVFREELLANEEALKFCFTESVNIDIWILSDS
ncbi:uncharacterized protein TNCV_1983131 [Trichonephila clavipes]|nr:uncharacterized protein TNCV_1983131 [Trichonephila clavipes]